MVTVNIGAYHSVQMGDYLVDKVKTESTCKYTDNGYDNAVFAAVFQRGDDESQTAAESITPAAKDRTMSENL